MMACKGGSVRVILQWVTGTKESGGRIALMIPTWDLEFAETKGEYGMREILGKLEREFLTRKAFCCFTILGCLLFIAPLLYIGRYNHGLGDDLRFPFHVHCTWLNTHNLFEVLKTAFSTVADTYMKWQGTYSSVFFFAISPMAFGEQYVHVVPYMMIGMTGISTAVLLYAIAGRLFGLDMYTCVSVVMVATVMQCVFMYTPASGMYYYNAAVHYVFMQGFFNLTVGFAVLFFERLYRRKGKRAGWISALCACAGGAFMAAGANFSTALLTAEILFLLEMVAFVLWRMRKDRRNLWFTIPFLVGETGFLVNILAPGNAVRQANYVQKGVLWTIGECFSYSFSQMLSWVDVYVCVLLILLLPVLLKATSRVKNFSFRCPLAVAAGLYCLYASMFAPGFYALGYWPISRNQNICKMFLMIGLLLLETYLCGWITHRVRVCEKIIPFHGRNVFHWTAVQLALLLLGFGCFLKMDEVSRKATFVSYGAFRMTVEGEGIQYWHEYLQRLNIYRENSWSFETVYVPPYIVRAYPLWVTEITEVPENDSGRIDGHVALWYGLEAIYEKP